MQQRVLNDSGGLLGGEQVRAEMAGNLVADACCCEKNDMLEKACGIAVREVAARMPTSVRRRGSLATTAGGAKAVCGLEARDPS